MTDKQKITEILKAYTKKHNISASSVILEEYAEELLANGVIVPSETGMGGVSDGYHTFNELYHHRAILFSVICNTFKEKAWKSKKHDTGDMYDGMFIVGIETPQGQATYHYDIESYWDIFQVKELPNAPKWDGHTPEEAIKRISTLKTNNVISLPCKVGQKIWHVYKHYDGRPDIKEGKISMLTQKADKSWHLRITVNSSVWGFTPNEIGTKYFLTKEEAEEKLKELGNNG